MTKDTLTSLGIDDEKLFKRSFSFSGQLPSIFFPIQCSKSRLRGMKNPYLYRIPICPMRFFPIQSGYRLLDFFATNLLFTPILRKSSQRCFLASPRRGNITSRYETMTEPKGAYEGIIPRRPNRLLAWRSQPPV